MTQFNIAMGVGRREPLTRVGEIAAVVEDLGFSRLWIQDNPLTTKDPYIALTVAALNTNRITLGPGVSNHSFVTPASSSTLSSHWINSATAAPCSASATEVPPW